MIPLCAAECGNVIAPAKGADQLVHALCLEK